MLISLLFVTCSKLYCRKFTDSTSKTHVNTHSLIGENVTWGRCLWVGHCNENTCKFGHSSSKKTYSSEKDNIFFDRIPPKIFTETEFLNPNSHRKRLPHQKWLINVINAFRKPRQGQNCSYLNAWLKRHSYKTDSFCTFVFEYLERLVIDELIIEHNINISWLIVREKATFNSLKSVSQADIIHMDDVEVIIVFSPVHKENIMCLRRICATNIVSVNDIVGSVSGYESIYCLIQLMHNFQKNGVQTLVLKTPCAKDVKNQSEWEKIVSGWKWAKHWWLTGDLKKYFHMSGNKEEYIEFFTEWKSFPVVKYKDYHVHSDFRSRFVNIVNHVRPAVGIPNTVCHTIHIVGDSTALGYVVMDKDTSASALQRNINEKQNGEEVIFTCLIHGICSMSTAMLKCVLRDINTCEGDIVVVHLSPFQKIFHSNFKKSCEENRVFFNDCQQEFDRPHGMGEVFNDWIHMNTNGDKKIGEILYERLFVANGKIPIPNVFQHYYCGSVTTPTNKDKIEWSRMKSQFNANPGFQSFVNCLQMYREVSQVSTVIVVNCNPFTLGHLCLVETATTRADRLFLFVVEEDRSELSFKDRFKLVEAGTSCLKNVVILPSGKYILSSITLPEYFVKGQKPDVKVDATIDLELFCEWVVPTLSIHARFVGEEPFDRVTMQYNRAMKNFLPRYGVHLEVVSRKEIGGYPISASLVRRLLKNPDFASISAIVPESTLAYLLRRMSGISLEKT